VLETEEGLERPLASLDTIRDETIWWSAGAETPQRLADGEAVMGSTYNDRLFARRGRGATGRGDLDMQMLDIAGWTVSEGAEKDDSDLEAIEAFARFASDTQRLADQASYIAYGRSRAPRNRSSASTRTLASTWRRTCRPTRRTRRMRSSTITSGGPTAMRSTQGSKPGLSADAGRPAQEPHQNKLRHHSAEVRA
jgi:hypothetical protein